MSLVMLVVAAIVGCLRPDTAWSVTGACANCHVMHAMEGGVATQASLKGGAAVSIAPQDFLLRNTCLGCHAGVSAAPNTSTQPPKVYVTGGGTELAGGNFKYIDDNGDTYGHNPSEIANGDALTQPPGWKTGFDDIDTNEVGNGGAWGVDQLTCAGVWGCHGNHDATGVSGAHHNNTNGLLNAAAIVGNSYRFLLGIKGYEDPDYEFTKDATDHNVYRGEARAADTPTVTKDTISYLCAECHGIFHSGEGGAPYSDGTSTDGDALFSSPWIRHPVDFSMPYTDAAKPEYDDYAAYDVTVPVATSQNIAPGAMDVTVATDRIVMCLSCHRAHASAYPAALRWDYDLMLAGTALAPDRNTGCFACHSAKDGDP